MGMIVIELLGGLGMFLYGMHLMSQGIEKVAGNKLRSILEAFTKTKFLGVIVGLFFTAMIQSSSAATVMVVSFVNSGLMKLTEACGIILGANIGTTATALLVAFKLSTLAPIFIFSGACVVSFMKKPVLRNSGEILLGFGILFFGISMMSSSMAQLREIPSVIDFLSGFTNPVLGILLGLIITSIVQSSSVTVSILVVMASQGLIDLSICMYVILGCNIGSCSSAVLAALNGTKNAMRAALVHLLFNLFGTALMFVLLTFFSDQIEHIIHLFSGNTKGVTDSAALGRDIACAHFLFKTFQVAVFYFFTDFLVKCTYILVPGEDAKTDSSTYHLQYINGKALLNPAVAILLAVQEMERMAHMAFDNLNLAVDCLLNNDLERSKQVYETEKYIDYLNEKISNYLVTINQNTLPLADANMLAAYFHVVNDIERIGDHAENIAEVLPQFQENDIQFSKKSQEELTIMLEKINTILNYSLEMFVKGNTEHMRDVMSIEDEIDRMERELQNAHIRRLNKGKCSAQAGIYFSDIISGLERVSDHATNIAFSLTEAKNNQLKA